MATIKSYTDLSQSRKLAEILPLESADGFWDYHDYWYLEGDEWEGYEDYPRAEPYLEYFRKENEWKEEKSDVPCWSLTALLGVLPSATLDSSNDHYYRIHCMEKFTEWFDNPVDACYELILKLHGLNLL